MKSKGCICFIICFAVIILMLSINDTNAKTKKIKLNYSYYTMTGGHKIKLKAKIKGKVKWKSTNKKVATVSKKGVVYGKKKGKCTIIARKGKRKGKCKITVTKSLFVPVKVYTKTTLNVLSVQLDINSIQYNSMGESIINNKKSTFPLALKNTKHKVTWTSANTRIATVSSSGVVTAVSPGETTVYAKADKKSYPCKVVVTNLNDASKIENQKDAYEMLRRINNLRIEEKVKPLKILNRLMRAANARARELKPAKIEVEGLGIKLDKNFSHTRPNGTSFSTIIPEFSLETGSRSGENISFVTDTVTQREEFMNTCFKAFLDSKEHKKNMLSYEYTYIGIGHDDSIHFINYHTHPCIAVFWDQLFYSK